MTDACVRGQVDTLLLDPGAARELDIRPADHSGLVLGASIGEEPVRADLAVVAAACLTDAEVAVAARARWAERRWPRCCGGTRPLGAPGRDPLPVGCGLVPSSGISQHRGCGPSFGRRRAGYRAVRDRTRRSATGTTVPGESHAHDRR